jgi:DNA mismatch repair protein MutL
MTDGPPGGPEPPAAAAPENRAPPAAAAQAPPPPEPVTLGEVFGTYIVAECGGELYLIDKHAAHERLIYEELKSMPPGTASQPLLSPAVVPLSPAEQEALLSNREALAQAGLDLEEFGTNSVLVRSLPLLFDGADIPLLISEIAAELKSGRAAAGETIRSHILSVVACKAAVKGNRASSREELHALVLRLFEKTDVKYCPHGRPVAVTMTRKSLEKQFGRIV